MRSAAGRTVLLRVRGLQSFAYRSPRLNSGVGSSSCCLGVGSFGATRVHRCFSSSDDSLSVLDSKNDSLSLLDSKERARVLAYTDARLELEAKRKKRLERRWKTKLKRRETRKLHEVQRSKLFTREIKKSDGKASIEKREEMWRLYREEGGPVPPRPRKNETLLAGLLTPEIPPDQLISKDPLPDFIAAAVTEHQLAAQSVSETLAQPVKFNLKASSPDEALVQACTMTPLMVVAAHRSLLNRVTDSTDGQADTVAGRALLEDQIPFRWFQDIAELYKQGALPVMSRKHHRTLIISEAVAMCLEPLVSHWFPAHALIHCRGRVPTDLAPREMAARAFPSLTHWMEWDFGSERLVDDEHVRIVCNHLVNRAPGQMRTAINNLFSKRTAVLSERPQISFFTHPGKYYITHLPNKAQAPLCRLQVLFEDLLFFRLDLAMKQTIMRENPLYTRMQELLGYMPHLNEKEIEYLARRHRLQPKLAPLCSAGYYRVGTTVIVGFLGHSALRELLYYRIELCMKSHNKLVFKGDKAKAKIAFAYQREPECAKQAETARQRSVELFDQELQKYRDNYPPTQNQMTLVKERERERRQDMKGLAGPAWAPRGGVVDIFSLPKFRPVTTPTMLLEEALEVAKAKYVRLERRRLKKRGKAAKSKGKKQKKQSKTGSASSGATEYYGRLAGADAESMALKDLEYRLEQMGSLNSTEE